MSRLNTWNRIQLRYLQEECKRKRTCHVCNTSIPKGERHLAIHQQSTMGFWSTRQNVCFICVEELNRDMKTSVPKIKERRENRNKELFIENIETFSEATRTPDYRGMFKATTAKIAQSYTAWQNKKATKPKKAKCNKKCYKCIAKRL